MELTKEEIMKIIDYEVLVDCYSEEEVNMGWAIYMEENIHYPFYAEYEGNRKSAEKKWERVKIVNNETDDSNYDGEDYYVEVEYGELIYPVRIDDLRNIEGDTETMRALEVWKNRNLY